MQPNTQTNTQPNTISGQQVRPTPTAGARDGSHAAGKITAGLTGPAHTPSPPSPSSASSRHEQPPRRTRFVTVAVAITALGGLLFGYDTGVISGALLFIRDTFHLSSSAQEVVTSMVLVGAVIGAAAAGMLADRYGRRRVTVVAAAIFAFGAAGTALAPTLAVLLVGRFVVGLAIGTASFVAPLYISEVSPAGLRGSMVAVNQLALTSGIVLAYLVDYAFAPSGGWRWMFGLGVVPGIVLGVGMFLLPDSPRWLLTRGQRAAARRVLVRIRGTTAVEGELQQIATGVRAQRGSWRVVLSPALRLPLLVGVGLALFQQLTGINTVIYYAPTIFETAGFHSASSSIMATFAVGIVNVVFTGVAVWLLDRVGRRPLLLGGLIGMIVSLVALGAGFAFSMFGGAVGTITVASLMVYVGAFAIGLGPVFWLLISEIYPLQVRGRAMSVATVTNWGANLLVALTFLSLIGLLGRAGTFWLFAMISVVAWLFSWRFVPETKGRTLEQIEAELHHHAPSAGGT